MKVVSVLFIGIVLVAAFLRLWHLSGVPISPNWDEVSLGYNAYSILQTGRDEYGEFLPLSFRSFNDYKPPVYIYLTIPSVAFFGLNEFAVRFPSAVLGVVAVIGTFFLSRELLFLSGERGKKNAYLSLLTAFLLAISPWHIQFSRVAYESNAALTFCILGLLFFLIGLRKPVLLTLSAAWYGLAMHTYHSEKLFVPLFVLGLGILFRKGLLAKKKYVIAPLIIAFLTAAPYMYFLSQNQTVKITGRFSQTSVFAKKEEINNSVEKSSFGIIFFDTPIVTKVSETVDGYLSHFSPKWLFFTGDNDRHHAPSTGLLYIWEAPFLLIGFCILLMKKSPLRPVFFLWVLLAPLPAALTSEVPHAVRTLIFLPSLHFATAMGVVEVFIRIKKISVIKCVLFITVILSLSIFLFAQYFHLYFYQMNHEFSKEWQFGYRESVIYTQQNKEKYDNVIISTKLEQPYIFFLFYLQYDPHAYLAKGGTQNNGKVAFDRYTFRPINWGEEVHDGKTLYLLAPIENPPSQVHVIRYFDSNPAIVFAE